MTLATHNQIAFDTGIPLMGPVLTAKQFAKVLSVSVRTVWRLDSAGSLPRPIRMGKVVRWKSDDVSAWLEAGCPKRCEWESLRRTGKAVR